MNITLEASAPPAGDGGIGQPTQSQVSGSGNGGSTRAPLLDMSEQDVVSVSRLCGLLGDPTRVRMMLLLCRGPLNVTELRDILKIPQPTVSHHLGLLRRGGLLATRRDGKLIYYSLDPKLEYTAECPGSGNSELTIRTAIGVRFHIIK